MLAKVSGILPILCWVLLHSIFCSNVYCSIFIHLKWIFSRSYFFSSFMRDTSRQNWFSIFISRTKYWRKLLFHCLVGFVMHLNCVAPSKSSPAPSRRDDVETSPKSSRFSPTKHGGIRKLTFEDLRTEGFLSGLVEFGWVHSKNLHNKNNLFAHSSARTLNCACAIFLLL